MISKQFILVDDTRPPLLLDDLLIPAIFFHSDFIFIFY